MRQETDIKIMSHEMIDGKPFVVYTHTDNTIDKFEYEPISSDSCSGTIRFVGKELEYKKYTPVSNLLSKIGDAIINLSNKVKF